MRFISSLALVQIAVVELLDATRNNDIDEKVCWTVKFRVISHFILNKYKIFEFRHWLDSDFIPKLLEILEIFIVLNPQWNSDPKYTNMSCHDSWELKSQAIESLTLLKWNFFDNSRMHDSFFICCFCFERYKGWKDFSGSNFSLG